MFSNHWVIVAVVDGITGRDTVDFNVTRPSIERVITRDSRHGKASEATGYFAAVIDLIQLSLSNRKGCSD